jgi:hypothetical protein
MHTLSDQLTERGTEPIPVGTGERPSLSPLHALRGTLFRPRATFETMRNARRTHWWLVLVLMLAATTLLSYATVTVRMNMFRGAAFPEGFTPPAQAQLPEGMEMPEGTEMPSTGASSSMVSILLPAATGVAGAFFGYLVSSVVIFGMSLVMGGKAEFKQIFPVAVWATLPLVVRKLVHATVTLVTGKTIVEGFSGVLTMAEAASVPFLYVLLGQFDVYLVWSLLLLGIGTGVTSKLSRGKSTVVVLTYLAVAVGLLLASNWANSALADLFGTNLGMPGMMGPMRRR